jgi:hypothetical protein
MNDTPSSSRIVNGPSSRLKPPSSGVHLWRPDLILPRPSVTAQHRLVMPGEPAFRPEAVRAQVDAAQSILRSLSSAREALSAQAAMAELREHSADSDRARVSAAMGTYRVKAALDEVLRGTLREVTALMEGRSDR